MEHNWLVGLFVGALTWLLIKGYRYITDYKNIQLEKQKVNKLKIEKSIFDKFHEKEESLKSLKESKILSEEEYYNKILKLEEEKLNNILQNNSDYLQLLDLYNDGLFTKEELNLKIELIKSNIKDSNKEELKYDFIDDYYDDLALVRKDDKFGFINRDGEEIIPIVLDKAERFNSGKSIIELDGIRYIIDSNGEEIEA